MSIAKIIEAAGFAAERHRHQRRKDAAASPYINHPIALADVLVNEGGVEETDVLCAALLHDTIEDTATTEAELIERFGEKIAATVMAVSDDKSLNKAARKQAQIDHAPHLTREAKLVKLADKICNLRDVLAAPPAGWSVARRKTYFDWSNKVVNGLRGVHPQLEAVFDQLYARRNELI
ncbi:MAG: hypothetical protein RIR00_999 [Pseudomonadota bacterium]